MRLRYVAFVVVMLLMTVACGQVTKETVSPVPTDRITQSGKRVVIMPFADYTPDSSPELYLRRNLLVTEALEDEFARYGLMSALEEDVVDYLLNEQIIEAPGIFFTDTPNNNYMRSEVESGDWSTAMIQELQYAITRNGDLEKRDKQLETGTQGSSYIALDSQEVVKIGDFFAADYIVRGRLIEFENGVAKDSLNPFHVGVLPFFFNSSQRMLFGLEKSGKAVVQMRLMVQDARTGNLVWSNRSEVEVIPESIYANQEYRKLIAKAIRRATGSLVRSFVATVEGDLLTVAIADNKS
ncbi:MAG: hypothetical protein J7L57_05620 [Deltaproteobacteria bacterium]|nr:hypothetical protein [Candidatus Tharpella sp.]